MKLFPQNVISRIKIALAPIIKKINILGKFGDTINLNINKNGLVQGKMNILDKIPTNEIYLLLKISILNFSNFNFS